MSEPLAQSADTCAFFVARKNRNCRLRPLPGQSLCVEHCPSHTDTGDKRGRRLPCPLDARHTVYETQLEKHLGRCNSRPKLTGRPFYRPGVNSCDSPSDGQFDRRWSILDAPQARLDELVARVESLVSDAELDAGQEADLAPPPLMVPALLETAERAAVSAAADRRRVQASVASSGHPVALEAGSSGHSRAKEAVIEGAKISAAGSTSKQSTEFHGSEHSTASDTSSERIESSEAHLEHSKASEATLEPANALKASSEHLKASDASTEHHVALTESSEHLKASVTSSDHHKALKTNSRGLPVTQVISEYPIGSESSEHPDEAIRDLSWDQPEEAESPPSTDTEDADGPASHAASDGDRPRSVTNLRQQANLLNLAERSGLLRSPCAYVEFGAGKGHLCHWVARHWLSARQQGQEAEHGTTGDDGDSNAYLLIDRGSVRNKLDCSHKYKGQRFARVRIDIADLALGQLLASEPVAMETCRHGVTALGKHLCGAATDLALRCLAGLGNRDEAAAAAAEAGAADAASTSCKRPRIAGSDVGPIGGVIALCCHHRCLWSAYVGKRHMAGLGLGPEEFHLISRMAGWATCAGKAERSRRQRNRRELIGLKCKRLIDAGRVTYLTGLGYSARLVRYASRADTPENAALVFHAWP